MALVVPPTVVNNRDAEDPAFLACWRSSSSAASIFGAQNLNLKMAGKEFTVASHNLAEKLPHNLAEPHNKLLIFNWLHIKDDNKLLIFK